MTMRASMSFMPPAPLRLPPISLSICQHFFIHQRPTTSSLCSEHKRASATTNEEGQMESTDLEEIKAALWEQASHPCTRVSWGVAQVMAVRCRKGQLLALLRGRGHWYPVEAVTISRPLVCPTGACDIEEAMG